LIYSNTTQNEKYLQLYSKYFKLVKLDNEYAREIQKSLWYRNESYTALWTPEGSMNSWKANDRYTRLFEQSFKDPILVLDQETIEAGGKFLAQFGCYPSDWFVTLHVRSSKFGPGTGHKGFAYGRNASINDYFTAIDYITKLGGWVVRIGDKGSPEPLQLPNVIDYTNSRIQNDKVNCFLMARCKFMIGTNSGPINVPSTFGRPVIVTNSPSLCRNTYFPKSIFVPKLVMNKHNRILSLEESFNLKHGFSEFWLNEKKGYHWKNNTPDDILNSVIEMNTRQTDGLTLHQIEFDRIARGLGTDAIGTISNSFLENHIQELNFT
jgi:putative glycosyltransferase (TIGR04372 family)